MNSVQCKFFTVIHCSLFFLVCSVPLFAWPVDNGITISTAASNQLVPQIVTDESGGAIISWFDNRNGNFDIYSQRVNSTGSTLWTLDGVALCTATNSQTNSKSIDVVGGALIVWEDYRNGNSDIYGQYVNQFGASVWTLDGVSISTEGSSQAGPSVARATTGVVVITWEDSRNGTTDIYAEAINNTGNSLWTLNGVAVCTAGGYQNNPKIVGDGTGNSIITWEDSRNGNKDIYAQQVDSSGVSQWTLDGVAISTAGGNQLYPTIVSDGSGGAIITWQDVRNGNTTSDIYAQRVNSSGSTLWTLDGIAICAAGNDQFSPTILSNGSSGAIISWIDYRNGNDDIYVQAIDSSGVPQWTLDGVAICIVTNAQTNPTIISDGSGGAIITWQDSRNGIYDIYAQRVDSTGSTLWTLDGTGICTVGNVQVSPVLVSDAASGAIIAWADSRSGNYDIYAQRVGSDGNTNFVPVELSRFEVVKGIRE